MSIREMSRVWADSKQKGSALLLLLAIADNANDDGICWPSTKTLSHKTRMTERNVLRLIDVLSDAKEVYAWRRRNKGNVYVVLSGCDDAERARRTQILSDKKDGNVKSCHILSDIAVSHEPSRTIKEPSTTPVVINENGATWIFQMYLDIFKESVSAGEHDDLRELASGLNKLTPGDVREAMTITKSANSRKRIARKVSYMRSILQGWERNGKPSDNPTLTPQLQRAPSLESLGYKVVR